jgi:formylglycine-generating enzyme required for sulfatase activity
MKTGNLTFIAFIAISLICGLAAFGDTLIHKETGERFTGRVCEAKINDRTLVIKSDGTRVYLDLSEYEVIDDDLG